MTEQAISKPKYKPRKSDQEDKSNTFQARIDYVAKALRRGSWGEKFNSCFEHNDSNHLVAVIMLRAKKNEALRKAVMSAFDVTKWKDVPWHEVARQFEGMSARLIGESAEKTRRTVQAELEAIYRDPNTLMNPSEPKVE